MKKDNVNHPSHYTTGEIEVIDYIRDKLDPDQFVGYCLGNVLKYVSRYRHKGEPLQDLRKAQVYLGWAVEAQEGVISDGRSCETCVHNKCSINDWPCNLCKRSPGRKEYRDYYDET